MKALFISILLVVIQCPIFGQENLNSTLDLNKQEACTAIPLSDIARILEVEEGELTQEDMSFGKRRSICYYYNEEGDKKFFIRMIWKSEKAQQKGVLKEQYEKYLSTGDGIINQYEELSSDEQGQMIYGTVNNKVNDFIYLLRKRFNNKSEIQLEVTKASKDDNIKDVLVEVLERIK